MRFLDANIFVYAYYRPRRNLLPKEKAMKRHAKEIVEGLSHGKEEVLTTVVHVSEMANILKHGLPLGRLNRILMALLMMDNVRIHGVTPEGHFAACELADEIDLEPNDALAIDVMRINNVKEIYSFDEDFDKVEGIARLPKL